MPPKVNSSNPLLNKTDNQIKQMLEAHGFTVTELGNKKFKISRTIGDIKITQIFNDNTFSMSNFNVHYQGNQNYGRYFINGKIQINQTPDNGN